MVRACGIAHAVIDLSPAHELLYEQVLRAFGPEAWGEEAARLADGNTRARLRMTALYAVANLTGRMVVGTDNAAEWYTGYFTKYGDGGVDAVPLVHLTKGEVRELARFLGVPERVITKAPSAGLWAGQTDEGEMGITYDAIDRYLRGLEVSEREERAIETLHRNTEHKRRLAAAPPKFER